MIFVDNGTDDNTRILIKKLAKNDKRVVGVFLSRNFGPEASGEAALRHSKGEAFIFYECDMQDPAELIPDFINEWEKGYKIIIGVRDKSDENKLMNSIRKTFYKVFRSISNINIPVNAGAFGLLDRVAIDSLCSLPEKFRFFRGLRAWIGFKTKEIHYKRKERTRGKSSYNIYDYVKFSERGIFGFSYLILDFMIYGGMAVVLFSFLFIVAYLYTVIVIGNPIKASIPTMLVIVFFGGVQLLAISIIGKYIQVIVEETKNRPMYIVEETINIGAKKNK